MTFKEARKQARELAKENGYWSYIYQTKNKKEKIYEISNEQDFNSDDWWYVAKDGRIMEHKIFEKIVKKMKESGMVSYYPFSDDVMYYGQKWNMIEK